jgi:UDP-2,3-diacylglucosamine pyrophosphatase LpxH
MDQAKGIPVRTLLVSDVHLGCKHSRAAEFLHFLRSFSPDRLYIVGDFIDAWKINAGWYWSAECDQIIDHLTRLTRQRTKIYYVPGNHDAFLRSPAFRLVFPAGDVDIEVADEFVLETLGGWRFLVTHGDLFDFFETRAQWLSKATAGLYDACLSLNWWVHRLLLCPTRNPYGACAVLKDRVKRGVRFISHYETKIMNHARRRSCEGVICGHIHTPDLFQSESMLYGNTGDWVENCTGLVEHHDGTLGLVSRYCENQYLRLPPRCRSSRGMGQSSTAEDSRRLDIAGAALQTGASEEECAA